MKPRFTLATYLCEPNNKDVRKNLQRAYRMLAKGNFKGCSNICKIHIENVQKTIDNQVGDNLYLNSAFLVKNYLLLLRSLSNCWFEMIHGNESTSWQLLQDSLDCLHNLRCYFDCYESSGLEDLEHNILVVENAFPYCYFLSPGLIVLKKECSICKLDPDDPECPHIQGRLYGGRIANTIITECDLKEISLTPTPEDKRCIITEPSPDFRNIKQLFILMKTPLTIVELEPQNRHRIIITDKQIEIKLRYTFKFEFTKNSSELDCELALYQLKHNLVEKYTEICDWISEVRNYMITALKSINIAQSNRPSPSRICHWRTWRTPWTTSSRPYHRISSRRRPPAAG